MAVAATFREKRKQDVGHEALPRIDPLHNLERQLNRNQVRRACVTRE